MFRDPYQLDESLVQILPRYGLMFWVYLHACRIKFAVDAWRSARPRNLCLVFVWYCTLNDTY